MQEPKGAFEDCYTLGGFDVCSMSRLEAEVILAILFRLWGRGEAFLFWFKSDFGNNVRHIYKHVMVDRECIVVKHWRG